MTNDEMTFEIYSCGTARAIKFSLAHKAGGFPNVEWL